MNPTVVFAPEVEGQMAALFARMAAASSPSIAERFGEAVLAWCEALPTALSAGVRRNDVRSGLRLSHFRGRVAVAYVAGPDLLTIVGVYYAPREGAAAGEA